MRLIQESGEYSEINPFKDNLERLRKNDPSLTSLDSREYLTEDDVKQIADSLKLFNTYLSTLDLSNCKITDAGIGCIAEALKINNTVKILSVANNRFSSRGVQFLSEMLKKNSSLTSLDLGSNKINDESAEYLSSALTENSTLTTFILRNNKGLTQKGVGLIANALKKNRALKTLVLKDQDSIRCVQNEGAKHLALALTENRTLIHLDLQVNGIGSDGVKCITDALINNNSLKTLRLDGNLFYGDGTRYIAEMLIKNNTLTQLSLAFIGAGSSDVLPIADALKSNTTLTILDIRQNNFGDEEAARFAEMLTINNILTHLYVGSNNLDIKTLVPIEAAIEKNYKLIDFSIEELRRILFQQLKIGTMDGDKSMEILNKIEQHTNRNKNLALLQKIGILIKAHQNGSIPLPKDILHMISGMIQPISRPRFDNLYNSISVQNPSGIFSLTQNKCAVENSATQEQQGFCLLS